jgi:hypothetical protein
MAIDFGAFTWLHVVASELDFLCFSSRPAENCGVLAFDGYAGDRVALLATTIGLHAFLTVGALHAAVGPWRHGMRIISPESLGIWGVFRIVSICLHYGVEFPDCQAQAAQQRCEIRPNTWTHVSKCV